MKNLLTLIVCFGAFAAFSQKLNLAVTQIPDSLKLNANAVVRSQEVDIVIASQRKMKISTKRTVTVFNEKGQNAINAVEHYDRSSAVNSIEATVYNAFGQEVKKIKKGDFKDHSATDEGTVFSDNRVLYLDYNPTQYPFTVVFQSEVTTSNTAHLPSWMPLDGYYVSVQQSRLNVAFPDNLGFKKKEQQLAKFKIQKTADTPVSLSYEANDILACKPESDSPSFSRLFPKVMLGLEVFNLEGIDGNAKTWQEFGQWYAEKIAGGTTEIPEETKAKIKALVGKEQDPVKKAKIIYNYVQQKSRYVSIQVGIGGWKPMYAKDVDRLGYGDCKALSNYTKALLEVVGVPSYNTILYGERNKTSIDPDFVSLQGNHMILSIPNGNNYIWLECTSQDSPFGYQANFTDDREVLVVKPTGGEIVRTQIYPDAENTQLSKGSYGISEDGALAGKITIVSQGTQYEYKSRVESMQPNDRDAHYKSYWGHINNLKIDKMAFSNDKDKIAFTENAAIRAGSYAAVNGNTMMFALNAYTQAGDVPQRYRVRNNPLEIQRGFLDQDEIEITLPENYTIDAKPDNFEIKGKFGEYTTELVVLNPNKLLYKRSFLLRKGLYDKTDYENYRKFREQIAKADNSKILLTKKT